MKAAFIRNTGNYHAIQVGDLPMPVVQQDEVLIKVKAVSVNHVDTFVRSGAFATEMSFPFIIGRDAIGKVVKIGADVENFAIDDHVWTNSMGYDGRQGVSSEFASIPSERLFKIPKDVDEYQLLASVHSSATAAILLNSILKVNPGQNILIEGGAGHVGKKLVTIAKQNNLIITTTSNQKDFECLKNLGVTQTADYNQPISTLNNQFDFIVDTSGKIGLQENIQQLKVLGKIGMITPPKDNLLEFNASEFYTNSKSILGFVISHASLQQLQEANSVISDLFKQGLLLDDDLKMIPIEKAQEAHQMLENNLNHSKRLILKFTKVQYS